MSRKSVALFCGAIMIGVLVPRFLERSLFRGASVLTSARSITELKDIHIELPHEDEYLIRSQALALLQQKIQVLDVLNAQTYIDKIPTVHNSSVASHMRHSLDHFQTVITASEKEENYVGNYDNRNRNTDLETDIQVAKDKIRELQSIISTIDLRKPIKIAFYGESKNYQSYELPSYVGRELSFASHHALHHMSTVKLILQAMGYENPQPMLGIALSTQKDMETIKRSDL
jgi:hypothetical protein